MLEAPGDSSAGCWWFFTHPDHPLHSCCFASHTHLCDQTGGKTSNCRRRAADAEVTTEVDGVPACTLALRNLTGAVDKGNYQAVFPANLADGLDVSLWIFAATKDQPVRENRPGFIPLFKNCNVDPFAHPERDRKCWCWGECHPAEVNRQNFDCSVCPTEDPTTWITSAAGIQKRTISDLTHICLNFKEGINMKQAICGSCGTETTTAS